jgi:hypothetical protein
MADRAEDITPISMKSSRTGWQYAGMHPDFHPMAFGDGEHLRPQRFVNLRHIAGLIISCAHAAHVFVGA